MSKELVDGQERFDGFPVTLYEGRFSGSFDIPADLGAGLEYDDVVTFCVTVNVGKATIDATKLGDLKRTNALPVQHVVPISKERADEIYAEAGIDVYGVSGQQLSVLDQNHVEDEEDFVDEDEVFTPESGAGEPWTPPAPQPLQPKVMPVNFTDGPDDVQVLGEPLSKQDKVLAGFLEQP